LLHSGDSNIFPEIREVKLIFTACFPDYYDDYLSAFRRLKPELVVPFHYDPEDEKKDALGLVKLLNENDIQSKIIKPGDHIEI
ncbi:MAG: MBL fold metallo-hydrolase, partial [Thermoplasmatota archaeon]